MISSVALSVLLTVAYTATACYALLRWASLRAGRAAHPGDQVAELSHLVMSLAMIGMTWGYGGSIANQVQIVAFIAFAGYFATRLRAGHACPAAGYHLLMAAAMAWMVASMPLLIGMPVASSGAGGHSHDGHGAASATPDAAPMPTPTWALIVTFVLVASLLGAAVHWARRAATATTATTAMDRSPALVASGTPGASALPAVPAGTGITWLTPRSDALCHLVMSLGMVAMFLAMV